MFSKENKFCLNGQNVFIVLKYDIKKGRLLRKKLLVKQNIVKNQTFPE